MPISEPPASSPRSSPEDERSSPEREREGGEARASRRVVTLAIVVGSCAVAAAVVIPAAGFVAAPARGKGGTGRWVRTLRVEQLAEGEPKRVAIVDDRHDAWSVERRVELGSVWLVKHGGAVTAFSSVCPHLGCSVNLAPGAGAGFACPCHSSAFDAEGRRRSGPSPRDLDALATRIEDGFVAVDFHRFRIGVPEKVDA